MQKHFLLIIITLFISGALNATLPAPKDPPFVSKDTIEAFLDAAKAIKAKDFTLATEVINKNPEILDSTMQRGSLWLIVASYKTIEEKTKSKEQELSILLNADERHILDIAAEFGTPEFVEFAFQKFLDRHKVPMPSYSLIDRCIKAKNENIPQVASCLGATRWLNAEKNPLVVAAADGKLKNVKTIVEFVKKYYKEQGLPLPNSFFHSGFIGQVNNGKVPAIATATVDTPSIRYEVQQGGPSNAQPTIRQQKKPVYVTYTAGGPLLLALYYGHKDVAQYLINEGALDDTPRKTQYGLLPGDGYLPIAFYIDPYSKERKSYTVDLAKYAREAGLTIPVSTSDLERLSRAVKNNDLAKVKKIVLINKELVLNKDREGMLPIEWAGNKLEIAQFLKEQGSPAPESLLYYAFGSGSIPVAKWLVELKMDPKAQLDKLIDVARRNGQEHMITYLGELGLNV